MYLYKYILEYQKIAQHRSCENRHRSTAFFENYFAMRIVLSSMITKHLINDFIVNREPII